MKILYLDVETLPGDKEDSNLKLLYKKKLLKGSELSYEDYIRGTSFDGGFGRVLCIALAVNQDSVKCYCNDKNEKKTLEQFWEVAKQIDLFVGHNALDFDLRFLWQRSIVLGVKPSWQDIDSRAPRYLSFARYRSSPVFDIMHEWVKWGRDNIGLEHIALALGISSPKEGIDGSQVAAFYEAGKIEEICEYCKRDVETTRAIYKKMTFDEVR